MGITILDRHECQRQRYLTTTTKFDDYNFGQQKNYQTLKFEDDQSLRRHDSKNKQLQNTNITQFENHLNRSEFDERIKISTIE